MQKARGMKTGVVCMALAACLTAGLATRANAAGLVTQDLTTGITPTDLVNNLVGTGVAVSNVQYTGANVAAGLFTGGTGIIGFESGIILSSGDIANVIGPNLSAGISAENGAAGDANLSAIIGDTTYDAAVLEFDFVPKSNVVSFTYVFASDEYNEFVNQFNDVFAFFINGVNQALVPGTNTVVSINTVNSGMNPSFYINNDNQSGAAPRNTEMDGMTVVLTLTAQVNQGVVNHIKLAITDALDELLDSNVFIAAGSFTASSLTLAPLNATNAVGTSHTLTATAFAATGAPLPGVTVTFSVVSGPHAGTSGAAVTNNSGIATWSYTGTAAGIDTIRATATIGQVLQTSNNAYKTWDLVSRIHIVKTANPPAIQPGDLVTYTYTVTNTGSGPLSNITVADDQAGVTPVYFSGDTNSNGILEQTETWIYRATAHPNQTVTNIGTASGNDDKPQTVTATHTATAIVLRPVTGCYNSQAFKGTLTLVVNWLNNGNPSNCDAWSNVPRTYDLYMVLCFAPVNCPDCPIEIVDIRQWIVNKNAKPVEIWESDGITMAVDSELISSGGTNASLLTYNDYIYANPRIVLTGKRTDKMVSGGFRASTIASLSGNFGSWDVSVNQNLTCAAGDQIVYGTVSLTNYKVKLPATKGSTSVSCGNCDLYLEAVIADLQKKYPKAAWLNAPF